ncbi:hypothetical protein GCM10010174_26010 [Kutzneria viridogrisea]|uniref:Uncharacterized protein n=1 Tax=Kutzneria viridogrisea TaxID=47990 RepID=A0ABR6BRL2_9PSEU|nr:hypothetical protein [Kutzneria viridogrisea]
MFNGTIPAEMRSIVAEHALSWPADLPVYVGCSGNLTIERAIHALGRGTALHGNDITSYSCALGWHFTGLDLPFELKPDSRAELEWLEAYLDGSTGTLAVLMLGTRFLQFVGREGAYYETMVAAYREQMPQLYAKTCARLDAVTLRLGSFWAGDVRDYLDAAPGSSPVVLFPPFYGSGDYESMFAALDRHFDWPVPEYRDLDEAGKDQIIEQVVSRPHWMLGLHHEREDLAQWRRGRVQTSNRGVPITVYASGDAVRVVTPRQALDPIRMRKIAPDEELQGPLRLHALSGGQFAGIRSQFMSKTIKPGSPLLAVGVSAGGALIGAFAYLPGKYDPGEVYLMSDFPVSWSKYKRLSKLIVLAAMSAEAQLLVQRSAGKRVTAICTTAFSNNPQSSKYGRGIPGFRLVKRTEPAADGIHRYQLQYSGTFGAWSLAEALELWQAKHAAVTR